MNLIQLTHPKQDYELWVDPSEIVIMERSFLKKNSPIINPNLPDQETTQVVLRNNRIISVIETPSEILAKIKL